MAELHAIEETRPRERSDFAMTPTAEALFGVFDFARTKPGLALISGAPGIGKTATMKRYAAEHERVYEARLDVGCDKRRRLGLTMLKAVLRSPWIGNQMPSTIFDGLRDRLWMLGGERQDNVLLIVDECQHALDQIEWFRDLFDTCQGWLGLVLVGNNLFRRHLAELWERGETQLESRALRTINLNRGSTRDDVAALAELRGIGNKRAIDALYRTAQRTRGWLRTVAMVIDHAERIAGAGKAPGLDEIETAIRELYGADS